MSIRVVAAVRGVALALFELAREVEALDGPTAEPHGRPGVAPAHDRTARARRPERPKYVVPAGEVSPLDRKRAERVLRSRGYVIREEK